MIGAVDIGGTKIAVGMVTESGQVLAQKKSPTDTASYANGLSTIGDLLRETAQIAGVEITGPGLFPLLFIAGDGRLRINFE